MVEGDWQAPVFLDARAADSETVVLTFDEPVTLHAAAIEPGREVVSSIWTADGLHATVSTSFEPGAEYWIDATVVDESGNSSTVLVPFFGHNPRLPEVVINEFVCEGSGNRPDWVELLVLSDGNTGGMCLYEGSPSTWDSRAALPAVEVSAGDYIVVHFKPEGSAVEVTETTDRAASGGNDAHPEAWDVWVEGGDGIPNTTGGLSLTSYPDGPLLDAVLYSTRAYDPTSSRRGFGTDKQLAIFEEVVAAGEWNIAGSFVVPEDAVFPEDSTATRSISRTSSGSDTNSAADWHITPTSGATPGSSNTDEIYGE